MSDDGSPERTPSAPKGWRGVVTGRTVAILLTFAALVGGLVVAGKLGPGGSLLPGIGLVVLVMLGSSFMDGGHGGGRRHRAHGSSQHRPAGRAGSNKGLR